MKTIFNTGDTVYIPATITSAFSSDGKIYYHISESDAAIEEKLCRTADQTVQHQTAKTNVHLQADDSEVDAAIRKIYVLEEALKKASSLIDELASKDLEIMVNMVKA